MNPIIYEEYTGVMSGVLQHLSSIQKLVPQEKITIKVPHIPGFNDNDNLEKDVEEIKEQFGFFNVIKTGYIVK